MDFTSEELAFRDGVRRMAERDVALTPLRILSLAG